jgi:hypothetical protein
MSLKNKRPSFFVNMATCYIILNIYKLFNDILRSNREHFMSRYPNSGQNQNIRKAKESFEKVATFKYLGTTLTNKIDIHDEIKSRLNSGNACCYSVQNLLSSRLIKKP